MPSTPRRKRASLRTVKVQQRHVLRETILATARDIVHRGGYEALTMRKLAHELDCAPMSLYTFFKDKNAILMVLAQEIFEDLTREVGGAEPEDALLALRQGCRRYIQFGLENPDEYRIIFMAPGAVEGHALSVHELLSRSPSFAIKVERVQRCIDRGFIRGDAFAAATMLWTMLHGVVSILIARPSFPFGDVPKYVERMIDLFLQALTSQNIAPLEPKTGGPAT